MSKNLSENMLSGLENESITMENVDKYFQQTGLLVKVHVGRIRGNFELKPAALGVNMESNEIKSFFEEHVKNGSMSFIPFTFEKNLQKIETRIRMTKIRMAIGYDNCFMPIDVYKEYAELVKEAKKEYLEVQQDILNQWDTLKSNFVRNLEFALTEMNTVDKERVQKAIMMKFPTKEDYAASFYMRCSLKAFPVMANLSLLDDDLSDEVRESAIQDNLSLVKEAIGIAFNDIFQISNKVYQAYGKKRKLENKTKGALSNAIKSIKAKNVLKHPSIEMLVEELNDIYFTTDADEALELSESVLAKSYGEAKSLDLFNFIDIKDCELSESDLEILYQAYVPSAA